MIKGEPKQVLRYSRWPTTEDIEKHHNGPLQITSTAFNNMRSYKLYTENTSNINNITNNSNIVIYNPIQNPTHYNSCMICQICGRERKFEFQVMPQLLYYMGVDKITKMKKNPINSAPINHVTDIDTMFINDNHEDIDFGTIDVYTCPSSCDNHGQLSYVEEQVFVIPFK